MPLNRKNFQNKVRETFISRHFNYRRRSSQKSVPQKGLIGQPQKVEVHFDG